MDLKESARQWLLQNLPYDRGEASLVTYLNGLDAHGLLVAYHNWMNRLVKPHPRTVHKSEAFQQNPLTTQRASDLAQIIADIEQGRDLTKYLSRDIVRAVVRVPGPSPRSDLDLMLNDWGVHHLHILTQVEIDGFVKRDKPLLFVVFKPQAAYLIDIMMHGDWTSGHVLEVLATEWLGEGIIHQVPIPVGDNLTDENRKALRKKHGNASFEIGGQVFMPAGGLVASGTTIAANIAGDRLLPTLEKFEQRFVDDPDWLRREVTAQGAAYPNAPEFEFAIREDGYGVIEVKTGTWMNLTKWLSP